MKAFFLFFFLIAQCYGDPIILYDEFNPIKSDTHQIVLEDTNATFTAQGVLESRYTSIYPKSITSYTHSIFWSKLTLKNDSSKQQIIIFRNSRAGIDKIDVNVYHDNNIIDSYKLGDMRDQKLRSIASIKSVFGVSLNPYEEVNIVTRFESLGPMNLDWEIMTPQQYSYSNLIEVIIYTFFGGVLFALIIYNSTMFFNLKEPAFLFYLLHAIALLWYQYAVNGMFYFLDIGLNLYFLTISAWISPFLLATFFMLFMITFFRFHERNRKIFTILAFVGGINFLISFVMIYQLIDPSLLVYSTYFIAIPMLSTPFVLIISIYALAKKYQGALYFVIGEGVYLLTIAYVSFSISGHVSTMQYSLIPLAFLFEMILLSMALAHRVAEIKLDNDLKNSILIEEEKFVSVGKSIGNIAHQWKEPISQLSSYLMHLEGLYHIKKHDTLVSEFGSNIAEMNSTLEYMKGTVNDLYDFYSNSDLTKNFNIRKKIDMAYKLQRDKLILSNVDTTIDCPEGLYVSGEKHALSNILMILFDNSIYQLTHTKAVNPTITIRVRESGDTITLLFGDNGGGIDPKMIDTIFTKSCTTKGDKGCGFGLILAHKLVNERLNGSISVENTGDGTLFTITLQKGKNL